MPVKYIPEIGDWFNAYETLKSGKKYKHFMGPFLCNNVVYQTQKGIKYRVQIETENFRFPCNVWEFEKVEK